jgi:hypothetical protein
MGRAAVFQRLTSPSQHTPHPAQPGMARRPACQQYLRFYPVFRSCKGRGVGVERWCGLLGGSEFGCAQFCALHDTRD